MISLSDTESYPGLDFVEWFGISLDILVSLSGLEPDVVGFR